MKISKEFYENLGFFSILQYPGIGIFAKHFSLKIDKKIENLCKPHLECNTYVVVINLEYQVLLNIKVRKRKKIIIKKSGESICYQRFHVIMILSIRTKLGL